jgi:hypothetical protein
VDVHSPIEKNRPKAPALNLLKKRFEPSEGELYAFWFLPSNNEVIRLAILHRTSVSSRLKSDLALARNPVVEPRGKRGTDLRLLRKQVVPLAGIGYNVEQLLAVAPLQIVVANQFPGRTAEAPYHPVIGFQGLPSAG